MRTWEDDKITVDVDEEVTGVDLAQLCPRYIDDGEKNCKRHELNDGLRACP